MTAAVLAVLLTAAGDVGRDEFEARRERIEKMSKVEREQLERKYATFLALPAETREAYREIHRTLEGGPDGHRLRNVLWNYDSWLRTLSPWQRAEIGRAADDRERLETVKRIKAEQESERDRQLAGDRPPRSPDDDGPSRRFGSWHRPLEPEDLDRVVAVAENHLPPAVRDALGNMSPPQRHARALLASVRQAYGTDVERARRSWPSDPIVDEMIRAIGDPEIRDRLEGGRTESAEHRRFLLRFFILSALRREAARELETLLPQGDEVVRDFFRSLDKAEQDELMSKGSRGIRDLLAWRYLEEQGNEYAKDLAQLSRIFFHSSRSSGRSDGGPRRGPRFRSDDDFPDDRGPRDGDRRARDRENGPADGKRGGRRGDRPEGPLPPRRESRPGPPPS